jgi:hypothetical protein
MLFPDHRLPPLPHYLSRLGVIEYSIDCLRRGYWVARRDQVASIAIPHNFSQSTNLYATAERP